MPNQILPDSYSVHVRLTAVQRQLGNAVPSALAEVLARAMRRQLLGERVDSELALVPRVVRPTPAPESVSPAAARYLSLLGEHSAHPGTGKGHAARRRLARGAFSADGAQG